MIYWIEFNIIKIFFMKYVSNTFPLKSSVRIVSPEMHCVLFFFKFLLKLEHVLVIKFFPIGLRFDSLATHTLYHDWKVKKIFRRRCLHQRSLYYLEYDLEEDIGIAHDFSFLITPIYDEVRHFFCYILPIVTYFFSVDPNSIEPTKPVLKHIKSKVSILLMLISSGILTHQ